MSYLIDKYPTLYVPTIQYNKTSHKRKIFYLKMTSYDISREHNAVNKLLTTITTLFYSYVPHYIIWVNKCHHYIDPNLKSILIDHDKKNPLDTKTQKHRFVLLKLTLIIDAQTYHSNMMIYDRLKKIGRRFEPAGLSEIGNGSDLDVKLRSLLEECYGNIKYLTPNDYLYDVTFQLTSGDDNAENKNDGDPVGYCLAWSLWFVDIRLSNPDADDHKLVKNAISHKYINSILSDKPDDKVLSTNYYLDFIRNYSIMLDNFKNKFLLKLGINKHEHYKAYPNDHLLATVSNYFKK